MRRRWLCAAFTLVPWVAHAADAYVEPDAGEAASDDSFAQDDGAGLAFAGYLDVGFADVQGDGTSFAPGDTRVPADYVADAFAPAVNSRGDVASADPGRFTNGFLPRSLGIGGRPSAFISTINQDLRYTTRGERLLVFVRAQLLPRFSDRGNDSRVYVEQAFARLLPFDRLELSLSLGKFDPVFGIEYLDNQANLRAGITPSLIARYSTGQALGVKAFYRFHVAPLWSSFSINVSATNGGSKIEALQPVELSLTGRPVLAGRLGYELNLPRVQVKLGASALTGPRNDQADPDVLQVMKGIDARLYVRGLSLSGEWLALDEDAGAGKQTGQGRQLVASGFKARGFYAQAAFRLVIADMAFTPYARVGQRRAQFAGFPWLKTRRLSAGLRFDPRPDLALKAEWSRNEELAGAAPVDNDVGALSAVFSW